MRPCRIERSNQPFGAPAPEAETGGESVVGGQLGKKCVTMTPHEMIGNGSYHSHSGHYGYGLHYKNSALSPIFHD